MGSRKDADRWAKRFAIFHTFEGTKKVCDDADLLPAATRIQAQQDSGTEVPVARRQTRWKDYMAVIEEHALEASKLVIFLLYLILTGVFFFFLLAVSPLLNKTCRQSPHTTAQRLYTTITCACADNTRRSVRLQLWGLCNGCSQSLSRTKVRFLLWF